jgi:IclR family pca regulon transcriptional regulator
MVILNESLRRGLDLLRAFSRLRNPSLRHLAEATGMAKATTLRYLRTLEEEGYVALDPETKIYRLTPLVFELGHAALVSMAFPKLAEPYMDALANELGVTVNLARLDNIEIVMLGRAFATKDKFAPTPIRIDVGERLPALLTALGRVLLAEGAGNLDDCLAVPLAPATEHTVTNKRELRQIVQHAAAQGYAIVQDELVAGWTSCAISLCKRGETPYALGATVKTSRWPAERIVEQLIPRLEAIRALLLPDHIHSTGPAVKRAARRKD